MLRRLADALRHPPARIALAATLVALLCTTAPAAATSVAEGSIYEDLQWAESVITAVIGEIRVETNHRGIPETVYGLSDVRAVKGDWPHPFEIRIAGGTDVAGLTLQVHGVPEFGRGDRVLLFLRGDNEICPIIGLTARSFRISKDGTGRRVVTTYDGMPILGLDESARIHAAESKTDRGMTLTEFVGLLEGMMARPDYQDRSR